MNVNIDKINYIAGLAKLKFTEEEAMKFADEFEIILNHFENIDKEDLANIDICSVEQPKGVLRKDEVKYFENKRELYQNVKQKQDDYITIPKIIE